MSCWTIGRCASRTIRGMSRRCGTGTLVMDSIVCRYVAMAHLCRYGLVSCLSHDIQCPCGRYILSGCLCEGFFVGSILHISICIENFEVYPNPASDVPYIKSAVDVADVEVKIPGLAGQDYFHWYIRPYRRCFDTIDIK